MISGRDTTAFIDRPKRDEWADQIAPGTPIEITVRGPATTHTVSLAQIRRWRDGVAISPDEVLKRKRVKVLIGVT